MRMMQTKRKLTEGLRIVRLPDHRGPGYVFAGQGDRTSRPVTARLMIMRWISEVPSKIVDVRVDGLVGGLVSSRVQHAVACSSGAVNTG